MFTVSDNTPSAGCIQWTGLHMSYLGTTYSIQDGYTNYMYVWWNHNTPTQLNVSNTLPTLTDADCLVFLNKNGVHLTIPTATVLDGDLLIPGSVIAGALAANSVAATNIIAGAVTASALAAGSVTANAVAANAIGASAIAASVITGDRLVASTITGDKIAASAITANNIAANAIGAAAIASGVITADKLAAGTITSSSACIGSLSASKITTGTLDASIVSVTNLNASNITSGTISASKISGGTLTLGGASNGNGALSINNGSGVQIGFWDNSGLRINRGNCLYFSGSTGYSYIYDGSNTAGQYFDIYSQNSDIRIYPLGYKLQVLSGMTVSSYVYANAESHFTDGSTYSDPMSGTSCAIKATGIIAATNQMRATGFYNTTNSQWVISGSNVDKFFYVSSPQYLAFYSGGTAYGCNAWTSDISLKENIADNTESSLDKIMQIKHRSFDWKTGGHVSMGYVAQELQDIDPEFVFGIVQEDNTELLNPSVSVLIPHITKSIQQLKQELDEKNTEIENFKATVNALVSKIGG